jgi:putative PIG3 family NAD(P)H quinone oxidoreductase
MKAVVNTGAGGPEVLEIQDRPIPEPGVSQVRIKVHASALNRADISQRLGRYPAPPGSPADIPGLEYAGEIDSVADDVTMWKPGDRVMGIVGGGGHAEFVCAHEREVIAAPSNLSFEDAAAIPEVFLTAYDAVFLQLDARPGETLLIHAVGSGVGTAALQLAAKRGVRVIGTSRTAGKLEKAAAFGLTTSVLIVDDSWPAKVKEVAGDHGIDAILDLVGGSYLAGNVESLALRGRLISVGLTGGSRSELDLGAVMRKRLRMVGTVLRARPLEEKIVLAREFSARMISEFESGALRPVVDRVIPFADIREAHRAMESNESFGKIVLSWS